MEKQEFIRRLVTDLKYVASVAEQLIVRPTAFREVLRDERIKKKLLEDPVFFAVLMCNDKWLVNAPDHQNLLRDMHRDRWRRAEEDGENPWSSAEKTCGSSTPNRRSRA